MIEENKSISNLTNLFPLISQKHYEHVSDDKKDISNSILENLSKEMKEKLYTEAYICDQDSFLLGKVSIHSLDGIETVEEGIDKAPLIIPAGSNLNEARTIASNFVGESIPVTKEGKLIAAVTEGDIFTQVLEIEDKIRQHNSE